jgi:hypothetical protein
MSFAPALPLSGYAGWTLLKRTMPAQTAAFNASPEIKTDEVYFRDKIGSVKTAEQLVADRRLLKVALGAFGLEADINNRFFIRKVLEDGTLKRDALANKLADKSYQRLSSTFGFGNFSTPSTQISDFADKIITAYRARSFEAAVGEQDSAMRLALNAERELKDLAGKTSSENTKWYGILGSEPLRKVFETALGLPSAFGTLDIDQQLSVIKSKAKSQLGSDKVSDLGNADAMDKLLRRFLIRGEVEALGGGTSAAQNALTLLQNIRR